MGGRSWSTDPPNSAQPEDARFQAWMEIARGRGAGVSTHAGCGTSHNICCAKDGYCGEHKYGEIACSQRCPDSNMQIYRTSCWTSQGTANGTKWSQKGLTCEGGAILAAKMYIHGRGANPCAGVFGVPAPPASWDVGVAVFPKKRKVTLTGYVDD